MKKCAKCGLEKELDNFHKDKSIKAGVRSRCKECIRGYSSSYRASHKDEILSYIEANREIIRTYRENNKAKISEVNRKYRESNKERLVANNKLWRGENRDILAEKSKLYRLNNKESIRKWQKQYYSSEACSISSKKSRNKYRNAHLSRVYYRSHRDYYSKICSQCPSTHHVQAHHSDYNKPMVVTPLCQKCHNDWHKTNTPLNRVSGIFTESKP